MSARLVNALFEQRKALVEESRKITDKADAEKRDLTASERSRYDQLDRELRMADDRIDGSLGAMAADERANQSFRDFNDRPASPAAAAATSNAEFNDLSAQFRDIVRRNSNDRIEVKGTARTYNPGLEARSLVKTSPANMQPVSFYDTMLMHLTENSAVLSAGATIVNTDSGEDLRIPRTSALSSAGIVTEGSAIPYSDPTFGSVTLGAYKYAFLVEVSREMIDDTSIDLAAYVAKQAGTACGNALGNHLINGTGTGQPRGVLLDATAGLTGPTGTSTSFGSQQTAGQGTDLLNSLVGSLAEPYTRQDRAAFLLRTATLTNIRNLKASTGELVGNAYINSSPYPFLVDPFVPAQAANAKSVLFGDWSRYYVRMVNGMRFERSNDYAFNKDMVTFRAIIRADGALIDPTGAIKYLVNSAT